MRKTRLSRRDFVSLGAAVVFGSATLLGCGSGENIEASTQDNVTSDTAGESTVSTNGDPNDQEVVPEVEELDEGPTGGDAPANAPELDPDSAAGAEGTPDASSPPEPVEPVEPTETTEPSEPTEPVEPDGSDGSDDVLQQVVGMTEIEATDLANSAGHTVRVEERDGEALGLTQDFDEQRINFVIEAGQVTAARIG